MSAKVRKKSSAAANCTLTKPAIRAAYVEALLIKPLF